MITPRQQQLLKEIVEKYIAEVEPISSKLLASSVPVSSATIRNEMNELEKLGFIYQPHTSAGRVPTASGYRFYVENFLDKTSVVSESEKEKILQAWQSKDESLEMTMKSIAKEISEVTSNAVLVGFTPQSFYYTGLSRLFNQPEFNQVDLVRSMSYVVDHLDETIRKIFDDIDEIEVRIGNDNPFGRDCSAVIAKFPFHHSQGLFGILGPARMDYQKNFSLLSFVRQLTAHAHE
jgi:transcriptional regulator of heat shock response